MYTIISISKTNIKGALATLALLTLLIAPFLLLADTSEPSCSTSSDNDCDGATNNDPSSLYRDLDDNDGTVGNPVDEWGFHTAGR